MWFMIRNTSISSDFFACGSVFSESFLSGFLMLFLYIADGNKHRNQYGNQRDHWYDAALSGSLDSSTGKIVTTSDSKCWICLVIRRDQDRGWPTALSEIKEGFYKKMPAVYFQQGDCRAKTQTLRSFKTLVLMRSR